MDKQIEPTDEIVHSRAEIICGKFTTTIVFMFGMILGMMAGHGAWDAHSIATLAFAILGFHITHFNPVRLFSKVFNKVS